MLPLPLNLFYASLALFMTVCVARKSYGSATIVPGVTFVLALMTGSSLLLVTATGLLLLIGITAGIGRFGGWAFGAVMLFLMLGANVDARRYTNRNVDRLIRMRESYPLESIRARLAFHELHPVPGGVEAAAAYAAKSREHDHRWSFRQGQLKRLHDANYEKFVASPGFGFSRTPRVSPENLETREIRLVKLTSESLCFDERDVLDRHRPGRDAISKLHEDGIKEFLDSERMGYVETIDRVAGFESHAMANVPTPIKVEQETWSLARLELISLLSHDLPVAYVSDHLPNLEELGRLSTRSLDEFETSSLTKLSGGEDIVTGDEPTMIRMLGAIRASETCLACHSVPLRTLLGAFSYELRPVLVHESGTTAGK